MIEFLKNIFKNFLGFILKNFNPTKNKNFKLQNQKNNYCKCIIQKIEIKGNIIINK